MEENRPLPEEEVHEELIVRHKPKWRYFIYVLVVFGIALISLFAKASYSDESVWSLPEIPPLIASSGADLIGEDTDRINVLLMGVGGRGHDGAYLTDTVILASYKPSTRQVSMISIPRDMIVPIPGYGWRKTNTIYALADYKEQGRDGR